MHQPSASHKLPHNEAVPRTEDLLQTLTFSVRLRSLTAAVPLSSATLWLGRVMTRERTVVSVALRAGGSRLPTLCLARLKSMPTRATLRRFLLPGPAMGTPEQYPCLLGVHLDDHLLQA